MIIECPILKDERNGHVLLPFYRNRRQRNGYEFWAAYEFNSREDIDVPCHNATGAQVWRYPDGTWFREWGT